VDAPALIDEHSVDVPADRSRVWAALRSFVDGLGFPPEGAVGRLAGLVWAADPPSGFRVAEEEPGERVVLDGRHRFSRYRLVFSLGDAPAGATRLTATSYGDFPGPHGKAYRALVIGTGGHVVAVRRMLRTIRSRAL
jgi:hypothetical protein